MPCSITGSLHMQSEAICVLAYSPVLVCKPRQSIGQTDTYMLVSVESKHSLAHTPRQAAPAHESRRTLQPLANPAQGTPVGSWPPLLAALKSAKVPTRSCRAMGPIRRRLPLAAGARKRPAARQHSERPGISRHGSRRRVCDQHEHVQNHQWPKASKDGKPQY
jgi:hypothetical protein